MITTRKELVPMTAKQYTGIVLTILVLLSSAVSEAGKPVALTPGAIDKLKSSFKDDPHAKALVNAITNNSIKDLSLNREFYALHEDVFNFKIENRAGVTNQKSSGRCWIFAGFNIMRPAVMEKYNLKTFELSENHLFFWDKLEKANLFLEAIIETKKKDIDDREFQVLVKDPVPDGGWWTYVVSIVEKYGAVPKQVMPETENSSNTRYMNMVLNRMMRRNAVELRAMAKKGKRDSALRERKFEMLKDVYRMLALHLGVPPEEFTWRCEDKDGEIVEGTFTPVSFYEEAVGVDLGEYVSVFNHPVHPYNKYYEIRYCRNMPDIRDMDFVNLEVDRLREFALKALLDGEPVWFACDVGKENDVKRGVMAVGVYDYESLYGVDARLTKAERLLYRASTPNHAMALIGVDTVRGEPVKWLVENSWGADRGNKGYWTMYNEWFDEYVYAVIIHKRHLPDDVLGLLDTKPTVLPAWDPMRAVFSLIGGEETMKYGTRGDGESGEPSPVAIDSIRLTVLFDNYSYSEGFETGWGFSCLVEGTNKTILFDTGSDGAVLMKNIEAAEIDPGIVDIVFLSHYHWDHTGGLERFLQKNGNVALCVPASFPDTFDKSMREAGIETTEIEAPGTVCEGVFSTGEMGSRIKEQSLVIETDAGLIVITGCAHPGIVDIVERAKEIAGKDVLFVLGGFHLRGAGGGELERIISRFREMGVRCVGPSHCTGDEAIEAFKDAFDERYIRIGTGRKISASDFNMAE